LLAFATMSQWPHKFSGCAVLTEPRPNQEKYFYSALLKHRDEHLETYLQHSSSGVSYSASDYHHSKASSRHDRMPEHSPTRPANTQTSQSGFSIKNAEHLTSRHSFYDVPASEASYDPFRASRDPIVNPKSTYVNVTVHRGGNSNGSRRLLYEAPIPSTRTSSLRVETLRKADSLRGSKRLLRLPNTSSSLRSSRLNVSGRKCSRSSSRISVNSSQWLSSPPIASMRPSDLHKRGVQFSHLRRSSTVSALNAQPELEKLLYTPDSRIKASMLNSPSHGSPIPSSPAIQHHNVVRSRKENATTGLPTLRTRKMRDIDQEARKVSTELGKVCEEAFFRSSVSSSVRSSMAEKKEPCTETLPSSVHNHSPYPKQRLLLDKVALANRPLPPTPLEKTTSSFQATETPNAYTVRELAEMRERLAAKYQQEGASNQKYFNDILRQLDSLMPPESRYQHIGDGKCVLSAAQQSSGFMYADEPSYLQVIPEEGRFADADVDFMCSEQLEQGKRAITEPSRHNVRIGNKNIGETIRLVQPSSSPSSPSPIPWAPLVIRKQSNNSSLSEVHRSRETSGGRTGKHLFAHFHAHDKSSFSSLCEIA
jgi:serine/threonine-protein kinase HSL1 (negative regulator of Swe1 kinase)